MNEPDLIKALEGIVSTDQVKRNEAVRFLQEAALNGSGNYIQALTEILVQLFHSDVARKAAGLQLEAIMAPNVMNQRMWLLLPVDQRESVKNNLLRCLGNEPMRPSAAAKCVGYIVAMDLEQLPNVIVLLMNNVVQAAGPVQGTERFKEALLETIDHICAAGAGAPIGFDTILSSQSNDILTAIVYGMKPEEPSNNVRLAAMNALHNALEFTGSHFENETERNYIMQVVCDATQLTNTQVKEAALKCLVKIMLLYPQHMDYYMDRALVTITTEAISSDDDEVVLQGIEFWKKVFHPRAFGHLRSLQIPQCLALVSSEALRRQILNVDDNDEDGELALKFNTMFAAAFILENGRRGFDFFGFWEFCHRITTGWTVEVFQYYGETWVRWIHKAWGLLKFIQFHLNPFSNFPFLNPTCFYLDFDIFTY